MKLKNTPNDIFFMVTYHILAVGLTLFGLFTLTTRMFVFGESRPNIASVHSGTGKTEHVISEEAIKALSKDEKTLPKVSKAIGSVFMNCNQKEDYPAEIGTPFTENCILETKDRSLAVISFEGSYKWMLRVTPNTKIKSDELFRAIIEDGNEKENSVFNLIKGTVFYLLTNENDLARVKFKTFLTIYGVRGTTISVTTDGESFSNMAVKEGIVEAINLETMQKHMIYSGQFHIAFKKREEIINKPEIIDLYDWNLDSDRVEGIPGIESIQKYIEAPAEKLQKKTDMIIQDTSLDESLKKEITSLEIRIRDHLEELKKIKSRIADRKFALEGERTGIEKDILCLKSDQGDCSLFSEKILMDRGYPRIYKSHSFKLSMAEELRKYLVEKEKEIENLEREYYSKARIQMAESELLIKVKGMVSAGSPTQEVLQLLGSEAQN
jgi:hypothetical protein